MQYTINAFNIDMGRIDVTVDVDGYITTVSIEVPIIDNKYITGTDLDEHISTTVASTISRVRDAKQAVNSSDIERLVSGTNTPAAPVSTVSPELQASFHILSMLDKAARKLNFPSYTYLMVTPGNTAAKSSMEQYYTVLTSAVTAGASFDSLPDFQ